MTATLNNLSAHAQKWLPTLTAIVLVILIAYALAQLLWALWPTGQVVASPTFSTNAFNTSTHSNNSATRVQTIDVQPTLRSAIFGDYQRALTATTTAIKPVETIDAAPTTRLSLKLTGVIVAEPTIDSRAFIGSAQKQQIYGIGDAIKNIRGVSLREIYHDRVILNHNGRLEALYIQKPKPGNQRRAGRTNSSTNTSSLGGILGNLRRELLSNPQKASELIRISPVMQQGRLEGYRIYPGNDRKLFREIGLRSGDVITAINGETLDDPAKGFAIISTLSNAQQIDLTLKRRGREQNISVNLGQ